MKQKSKPRTPGKKQVLTPVDHDIVVAELEAEIDHLIARVVALEEAVHALSSQKA